MALKKRREKLTPCPQVWLGCRHTRAKEQCHLLWRSPVWHPLTYPVHPDPQQPPSRSSAASNTIKTMSNPPKITAPDPKHRRNQTQTWKQITLAEASGRRIPALVLEGGTIFSMRTRLRVGIRRFAICVSGNFWIRVLVGFPVMWLRSVGRRRSWVCPFKRSLRDSGSSG